MQFNNIKSLLATTSRKEADFIKNPYLILQGCLHKFFVKLLLIKQNILNLFSFLCLARMPVL